MPLMIHSALVGGSDKAAQRRAQQIHAALGEMARLMQRLLEQSPGNENAIKVGAMLFLVFLIAKDYDTLPEARDMLAKVCDDLETMMDDNFAGFRYPEMDNG